MKRIVPAALLLMALAACQREERDFRGEASGDPKPGRTILSELFPGATPPRPNSRPKQEETAYDLSEGKRLYGWFNCNGCHAQGGGDIGPPLMDETWIYGGRPDQIRASIVEGRPNGMPAFDGRLTDQQLWQIAAYVRSLSGQAPKDAAPGRNDHMQAKRAEHRTPRKGPVPSATPPSAEGRE